MRKVGRNDPCPCGSGVKYKYCCLHKDQEAEGDSSGSAPETTAEPQPPASAEEAWETFEGADYEERRTLVEEITGDPERMDGENAFHMLSELKAEAIERGDADWLTHILTRLEQEQPETYAAELPYLLSWHLEAAAVTGSLEAVAAERIDDLATMAAEHIDEFYPCIELIAYHAPLAPIAEAMDNSLADVRANPDIMPHGKSEFGDETVQYLLLDSYERHGEVDLQNPDLRAQIDRIDDPEWGEIDFDFLEQAAARLSGPNDRPWQVEDDPIENIDWLTMDFMCSVPEQSDIPLGRVHLARKSIVACYGRRRERYGSLKTDRLLRLEQQDVRTQLRETGSFVSSRPHRMGAFFSLLPRWLDFLERRELLNAAKTNTTYQNLRPLRNEVTNALRYFSSDPTLVRDVKAAWE